MPPKVYTIFSLDMCYIHLFRARHPRCLSATVLRSPGDTFTLATASLPPWRQQQYQPLYRNHLGVLESGKNQQQAVQQNRSPTGQSSLRLSDPQGTGFYYRLSTVQTPSPQNPIRNRGDSPMMLVWTRRGTDTNNGEVSSTNNLTIRTTTVSTWGF